ncbi:MAG: HlyD family secretion protein [Azospirillaceae bacterium]|nr:HlyD family secretion protein [Azospirillaceae bacterium]
MSGQPTNDSADAAPPRDGVQAAAPDPAPPEPGDHGGVAQGQPAADLRAGARSSAPPQPKAPPRRRGPITLLVVLLLLVGGGGYYWWSTKDIETTDDAYTDGRAVSVAAHVAGYVATLDVTDNQFVHKGDPLLHIDPRDFLAARDRAQGQLATAEMQLAGARHALELAKVRFPSRLAAAQASLDAAKANQFKAQTDYRRQTTISRAATTQQDVDYAKAALLLATAQVAQAEADLRENQPVPLNIANVDDQVGQLDGQVQTAKAELAQAELNLSWCVITAPQDGWVTRRNVEQGNYIQVGQQILALVSPEIWVTANFKESQLRRIRVGQPATVTVDAYSQLTLHGHVDSVQLGSGTKFSAFPAENATGNFIKIVQRVPVKIVIDSGLDPQLPLPLGLSVAPEVSVGQPGTP